MHAGARGPGHFLGTFPGHPRSPPHPLGHACVWMFFRVQYPQKQLLSCCVRLKCLLKYGQNQWNTKSQPSPEIYLVTSLDTGDHDVIASVLHERLNITRLCMCVMLWAFLVLPLFPNVGADAPRRAPCRNVGAIIIKNWGFGFRGFSVEFGRIFMHF